MTNPYNPLNITDDDIGKEGRFLLDGEPAVLVAIARNAKGVPRDIVFKWTHRIDGEFFNTSHLYYVGITRIPRKLYIGVERASKTGDDVLNTTLACSTRERVRRSAPAGWTIIEIPHPEDAP